METLKTVSFKEVHAELLAEVDFLGKKEHDLKGFSEKSSFLKAIGFNNSIAAKLYDSIGNNYDLIQDINNRYQGTAKFITEPQYERLCEKYNLYSREPKYFMGDIPDKNIKDMQNSKIFMKDLEYTNLVHRMNTLYANIHILNNKVHENIVEIARNLNELTDFYRFPDYKRIKTITLEQLGLFTVKFLSLVDTNGNRISTVVEELPLIEIAAIKDLFSPEAFVKSQARIIKHNLAELKPKMQVDLDPIVSVKLEHGRLIITAWGDEANDELVVNHKNN